MLTCQGGGSNLLSTHVSVKSEQGGKFTLDFLLGIRERSSGYKSISSRRKLTGMPIGEQTICLSRGSADEGEI